MTDKKNKSRTVSFPGSSNQASKLTDIQVEEIRKLLESGSYHREIANQFDVSRTCITRIANGTRYHVK